LEGRLSILLMLILSRFLFPDCRMIGRCSCTEPIAGRNFLLR
jgi:hypothetical protein